jgi:glycerol-3-phosphate acyltransferase PlsY
MKQPGRKFYHVLGGLLLLTIYLVLGREKAVRVYAALFLVVLALDIVRLRVPAVNRFVFARGGSFIREQERTRLTGTPAYLLGVGLTLTLFLPDVALAAVCFLVFGDVAATTIGERYGRIRIGTRTLEGTFAFACVAIAAGLVLVALELAPGWGLVVIGGITAAGVELLPIPVNDNLTIPLVSAAVMQLVLVAGQ